MFNITVNMKWVRGVEPLTIYRKVSQRVLGRTPQFSKYTELSTHSGIGKYHISVDTQESASNMTTGRQQKLSGR